MRRCELRLTRAFGSAVTLTLAAMASACDGEGGGGPHDAGVERAGRDLCASESVDGSGLDTDVDGCVTYRSLPCGVPPEEPVSNCVLQDLAACFATCDATVLYCQFPSKFCAGGDAIRDAASIVECVSCGIAGRPPQGLRRPLAPGPSPGAIFASMALLESASVRAFVDLAAALEGLGAPRGLRRAALRAAGDERRHARSLTRLARSHGREPGRPEVTPRARPSLVELLEDDAVGGCVGETFGALLLTWQARHAARATTRRTFAALAHDETRHAALAWEILRWGFPRLCPREQRRVARALRGALSTLEASVAPATSRPSGVRAATGLPGPDAERLLVRALATVALREASDLRGIGCPC